MIGRLMNDVNNPPGGVSHYGVDGTLDSTTNDQIGAYEQKYGLVNPYAGAKQKITTKKIDPKTGQVIEETETEGLPVTATGVEAQRKAGETPVVAPANYQYDYSKDPDAVAARAQILKDNPNAPQAPGFEHRVHDAYVQNRAKRGLSPAPTQDEINQQYQGTLPQQTTGSTTGNNPAVVAPTPAPGSNVQANIPQSQQPPPAIRAPTPAPARQQVVPGTGQPRRRGFTFVFPENEAPEGSWQRAWNETVGRTQLAGGLSNEDIQRGVQEAESRASFASAEPGLPSWYRTSEQPSPSPAGGENRGGYQPPENAPAVAGISPQVWGMVMKEEGPEFGPDGRHPSVFGLWGDKPGVESEAYNTVRRYGAHSPEAYQAVTSAWTNGFLRPSQPWRLTSPGLQGLVISDSQHQGGEAAARIIGQMGGWDRINQMEPRQAIAEYSTLRRGLWGNNQSRVRREEGWALANT
jgi:hypothetical protein